ncbi:lipoprotein [Mixta gaviniae]|uniref:lipoprotein n=1 Tax=Mixta gaviniae TaxID=665914 RepID=UPI00142D3580|nr:lipoprotein [Mixta gaviniae]
MKKIIGGLFLLSGLFALAGCQHDSSAVGPDGRPHAPSNQSVPGGPQGQGPVGQPQS